ncbi:MAG TPA: NUDIX hydrolase [Streptosporangiaceae bacterium]|nr:NUDIX hydrolase [Streptosporangiaceae bacterium]
MSIPDGIELRCSAVVVRQQSVLLVHRIRDDEDDWVLPGGTPRAGESMAACARREVLEETGLHVDPSRVAFVLEVMGPGGGPRTVDMVFAATGAVPGAEPRQQEPGLVPAFVPVAKISQLDLRPPLAGHLRGMLGHGRAPYAPYLANMWRPARSGQRASDAAAAETGRGPADS